MKSFFLISCKTNADLSGDKFNPDLLNETISLQAYQPEGMIYPGRILKKDTVVVYGNYSKTAIDSIVKLMK